MRPRRDTYPNELFDAVEGLHEVEVFCAIVSAAYDELVGSACARVQAMRQVEHVLGRA